ncbi:MAG: gamma-glutamyl-gamma-aminobutyrate hydrolase family protein [Candidatus Delongbacteria bacterium]|nr:gamma-glutamyl-gamma-aminobutyrate hydrolase family protein [Candidatus Delongbacteria bacterium]
MNAPLIGISMLLDSNHERGFYNSSVLELQSAAYAAWVAGGGGIPVALPFAGDARIGQLIDRLDGLLLSGGPDLDPGFDPDNPGPVVLEVGDEQRRTHYEHALLQAALQRRVPVLGVCRGMQQIAVSAGGELWQDLPTEPGIEGHSRPDAHSALVHEVLLDGPQPACFSDLPLRFGVNSTHHQAVKRLGRGQRVIARAADASGIIEALVGEDPDQWMLGVQWHPERLPGEPASRALMAQFLTEATRRAVETGR